MMVFRAEEQSQLQLVEREDIDDEEDLFEAIDKRKQFLSVLAIFFHLRFSFFFFFFSHCFRALKLILFFV